MEVQGKLFITVIQAQNLTVKQEKTTAAGEIVGAILDPFSSNFLQSIEKLQNFSNTHVLPIFTVPGAIIGDVASAIGIKSNEGAKDSTAADSTAESDGVICSVTMDDQEFKTTPATNVVEPKWDQPHSFNITSPYAEFNFSVTLTSSKGESFLIGSSKMNLLEEPHLWEQKPIAKWINLTKTTNNNNTNGDYEYSEDEIVGRVEIQLQYKFRNVWDCIYCGKMLLIEKKYEQALEHLNEAIQRYPTDPKLYSLIIDCNIGLKQFGKAIEAAKLFIKHDNTFEANLKTGIVLMEAGQLDRVQAFIDRAIQINGGENEKIQYQQLVLNQRLEINNVNKLVEAAYEDFGKGEFSNAIASLTKAIELNSHSPILYQLRALCSMGARNIPKALEDIEKILEIDHNWPKKDYQLADHISKDGQINVMAKKRWFALKSNFLFYYKDENEIKPQGTICLIDFGCAPKPNQKSKFQVQTKDRAYYLKFIDNPTAYDQWVTTLTKLSKTKLRLPLLKSSLDQIIWKNVLNTTKKEQKTTFLLPDVMLLPEQIFVGSGKFAFSIGDKIKSKLTSINQSECQMTGWLYKVGQLNKEWQKRYFFISGSNLYYAKIKEPEDKAPSITPTGTLPLEKAKIDPTPQSTNKANAFEVVTTLRRTMVLATDTQEQKDAWMKAIAIASGIQIVEKEVQIEALPSSQALLNSRSRRIKSLRAVPNENDTNGGAGGKSSTDGGPNMDDNLNSSSSGARGSIRISSNAVAPVIKPESPIPNKKITNTDVSYSESKYFTKFNLPVATTVSQPIISSKSKPTSSSSTTPGVTLNFENTDLDADMLSSDDNNSTLGSNNNNNNSSQNLTKTNNVTNSSNIKITTYEEDDDDYSKDSHKKGLLSGKSKSVNDDDYTTDKERCCKCSIQ
ncbi:hypothetical protein CYY_001206 [Polysphondylium violaceum]|uniref:Pleckstrin domain-containing protein n=1 Tax=Polysphondylium violaceum TaxID=133409 RepID=A0A8J4V863_9MYCE|nr:hypothetical protein CYY_001206 [Polysphondylium violaceum]